MIDFHSHILPGIDDGSASVEESVALLRMLSDQGVDTVVATPHFYPQEIDPDTFFAQRSRAFEKLKPFLTDEMPNIRLGAEVFYYQGISRLANLSSLRIEGSKLLLLEMPTVPWTEYMLHELSDLSCSANLCVVMAHIERYLPMQKRGVLEMLLSRGILIQTNASSFLSRGSARKTLKMMHDGKIQFIGTDCHNIEERKPRMEAALSVVREKYGDGFLRAFDREARHLLG